MSSFEALSQILRHGVILVQGPCPSSPYCSNLACPTRPNYMDIYQDILFCKRILRHMGSKPSCSIVACTLIGVEDGER